jgi:hypothetical protein
VRRLVGLWSGITLTGIVVMGAMALWHLTRRGRLLRDRHGVVKASVLYELDDPKNESQSTRQEPHV